MTGRGKALHPYQIKSSRGARKQRRHNNDENDNDPEDHNDDGYVPLIGDQLVVPDDGDDPLGPDDIGIFAFFFEGEGNRPDLEGINDAQLRLTQNDLHDRLRAHDEVRERAITEWLCEFEQKYDFANSQFLKNFAKVSALLDLDRPGTSRVKSA